MKVLIDNDAKARLWAFIRAVDVEVGGMGYAFLQDDGTLLWMDTFLIPQEVNSSEVDFETTGGDQVAIERAIADGVLDNPRFVWVSWHSHHTMKAFWSATDDKRIAAMNNVGVKRLLSFVGTHSGEYKMRCDLFGVQAHDVNIGQVTIGDVKFEAESPREPSEFEKQITSELEANVVRKTYTYIASKSKSDQITDLRDAGDAIQRGQDERRVAQELAEAGGTTLREAEELILDEGLDKAEDLLWDYYLTEANR